MRRLVAALAVFVGIAVFAGLAPPASAAPVTYVEPVSGRVVDPFRPPETPYGRGNRGLEYETAEGSQARASAPGRVTFAGNVGGALHVVIQHSDGVRTSYSFLRSISVRAGQTLQQSDPVGTTGTSFHFGARIGDAYIDPAILIASGPARVHLVPDGEFTEEGASDDHRSMWAVVADRMASVPASAVNWARGGGTAVADAARAIASGAIDLGALAAGTASDAMRSFAEHTITVLDAIVNLGQMAGPFAAMAAALADIIQAFIEPCTSPDRAPPPMAEPNNRIVVFIAGLGSSSNHPLSGDVRPSELGYAPGNVYDFSYLGGRYPKPYTAADTTGDLHDRARDLRDLLDQIEHDHPGAHVDLIAHSQGGLIAREALAHDYDGPTRQLPSVDHVITLATPHHGSDAATANAWLRWSVEGRAIRWLAKQKHTQFDLTGPGIAQLSETSEFIEDLNHRALRDGVAYTSIAGAEDAIVPAVRARLAGATNVIVDSGNVVHSHGAIKGNEAARREVRLALADAPPTCQSVAATTSRAFTSAGIATFEDAAGMAAASAP
jgi:pimeloyl-ACP methyl ester carboxylesterase